MLWHQHSWQHGKLEEAKQDMKSGRYSSVEDAISRIREKYGL